MRKLETLADGLLLLAAASLMPMAALAAGGSRRRPALCRRPRVRRTAIDGSAHLVDGRARAWRYEPVAPAYRLLSGIGRHEVEMSVIRMQTTDSESRRGKRQRDGPRRRADRPVAAQSRSPSAPPPCRVLALALLVVRAEREQPDGRGRAADHLRRSARGRSTISCRCAPGSTPLVTVYLDAVEGGRVEKVLVEDGAMVQQGQLLAVLSNSDLQLNLLARQTEVTQQINSMRSQELALAQTRSRTSAR